MILGLSPWNILGIVVIILFILILPTIMRIRMISSTNRAVLEMEAMVNESKNILIQTSKEKGRPSPNTRIPVESFIEFFVVPPVDMDPAGIVKKFEKILEMGEERFHEMASIIAPKADLEVKSNIIMTLKAIIGLNSVVKLVRHNLELARKTGNFQILLSLQMNLSLILRLVKAQFESVKSFSEGKAIGDGIGPLVGSLMMGEYDNSDLEEIEDMIVLRKVFKNRELNILRAKGPGARIGKLGKVASKIIDQKEIDSIITIDAASKLEGEKTGTVAEGIGVVVGGLGIDKWFLEEKTLKEGLKLDAIIIKMSPEEAIKPMSKKILKSSQKALETLKSAIMRSPEGSRILIIGVGNSCGIPNLISHPSQIKTKKEDSEK